MTDNERFFAVFDLLKKRGQIKTYTQLAEVLGTNKAGVNDLKNGKKKISVENIRSMKSTYPEISLNWLILEEGDMIDILSEPIKFDISTELLILQKEKIERLEIQLSELRYVEKDPILYRSVAEPTSKLAENDRN